MLEMLHADELITGETMAERFVTIDAARFCAGIWLEHYVFSVLKRFGFDKRRALMNAKIIDAKGNRNELDSIVIHKNTCYVIEDKTKNMRVRGALNVADQAVYKLAQLSRSMGLRTGAFLSRHDLSVGKTGIGRRRTVLRSLTGYRILNAV